MCNIVIKLFIQPHTNVFSELSTTWIRKINPSPSWRLNNHLKTWFRASKLHFLLRISKWHHVQHFELLTERRLYRLTGRNTITSVTLQDELKQTGRAPSALSIWCLHRGAAHVQSFKYYSFRPFEGSKAGVILLITCDVVSIHRDRGCGIVGAVLIGTVYISGCNTLFLSVESRWSVCSSCLCLVSLLVWCPVAAMQLRFHIEPFETIKLFSSRLRTSVHIGFFFSLHLTTQRCFIIKSSWSF